MDKGDNNNRETHDFMNVQSFSQLPFIRPAPSPAAKHDTKGGAIRLFGIEFGGADDDEEAVGKESEMNAGNGGGENNRRFECHYCCRNFPTSQALGGHQNAHKRERQHAKRTHLQSAMAHHHHTPLSDSHFYGLVNYRIAASPPASVAYPSSWTTTSSSRFYGGHHNTSYSQPPQQQQPINGSPMGMWRIPSSVHGGGNFHHNRSSLHHHPLPLFSDEELRGSQVGGGGSSSSQGQFGYEGKASMQSDHVSLDLHL